MFLDPQTYVQNIILHRNTFYFIWN